MDRWHTEQYHADRLAAAERNHALYRDTLPGPRPARAEHRRPLLVAQVLALLHLT